MFSKNAAPVAARRPISEDEDLLVLGGARTYDLAPCAAQEAEKKKDRSHIRCERVGLGLYRFDGLRLRLGKPRIAQSCAPRLKSRERRVRALGNETVLFLSNASRTGPRSLTCIIRKVDT